MTIPASSAGTIINIRRRERISKQQEAYVVGHFGCPPIPLENQRDAQNAKSTGMTKIEERVIPECFCRESIPGPYNCLQNAPLPRRTTETCISTLLIGVLCGEGASCSAS